ncbi:hypothetical protein BGZ94_008283 [Podila epigama]|nr:hypothetical protein BGZ94_008283 [Podila epigama]
MFARTLDSVARLRLLLAPRQDIPVELEAGAVVETATRRALALPEILTAIAYYLDRKHLLRGLLVSHSWYLVLIPIVWDKVSIYAADGHPLSDVHLPKALNCHSHLIRAFDVREQDMGSKSLNIAFLSTMTTILDRYPMPGLRSLTLRCPELSVGLPTPFLKTHIDRLSGLTTLDIGYMVDSGNVQVEEILELFPLLKKLRVGFSSRPLATLLGRPPIVDTAITTNTTLSTSKGLVLAQEGGRAPQRRQRPLLKHLEIDYLQWPAASLLECIAQCPDLVHLTVKGRPLHNWDWTPTTMEVMAGMCQNLRRIEMDPRYGSTMSESLIVRLLELLPRLVSLHIPRCDFGQAAFEALKPRMSQLEELNVANVRNPGMTSAMLIELMCDADKLLYLNASGIMVAPRQFVIQQDDPMINSNNSTDGIKDNHLGDDGTTMMWTCRHLKSLTIGFAMLYSDIRQYQVIYRNLGRLQQLEHLRILPTHFALTFEAGLEALSELKKLEVFDVHGLNNMNMHSEDVIQWMGTSWPRLRVLRIFTTSNHKTTMDERQKVAQWLQKIHREDIRLEMY